MKATVPLDTVKTNQKTSNPELPYVSSWISVHFYSTFQTEIYRKYEKTQEVRQKCPSCLSPRT